MAGNPSNTTAGDPSSTASGTPARATVASPNSPGGSPSRATSGDLASATATFPSSPGDNPSSTASGTPSRATAASPNSAPGNPSSTTSGTPAGSPSAATSGDPASTTAASPDSPVGNPSPTPAGNPTSGALSCAGKRIVVVGTGTEVGKTHLAVALVTALARRGHQVCGLKPIESGVPIGGVGDDAAALAAAGTFHVKQPPPYALPAPVSPHLAARRTGVAVDLSRVTAWVDAHPADWLVVETAGALLSPLGPALTNLDLGQALRPDAWILVAMDRLGVLHDVAACMLALRFHGVAEPPLVVLQAPPAPDSSTGTNAEELVELGTAPRVIAMPRGEPGSPGYQEAAALLVDALGG